MDSLLSASAEAQMARRQMLAISLMNMDGKVIYPVMRFWLRF